MVCITFWACILDGSNNNIVGARITLPPAQVFDPNLAAAVDGRVARSLPG